MGNIRNLDIEPYITEYKTAIFFELGSGYGTGIYHVLQFPFQKIVSVEIEKDQAELLQKVFRFDQRVMVVNALSRDALRQILPQIPVHIPIFFFCDAHFPGADLGKRGFADEQDENIRMPLYEELQIIKELRVDKGAKDFILIDDIMLYDDENEYEASHQKANMDILPRDKRNYLKKFVEMFDTTHDSELITQEQGYLLFHPVLNSNLGRDFKIELC